MRQPVRGAGQAAARAGPPCEAPHLTVPEREAGQGQEARGQKPHRPCKSQGVEEAELPLRRRKYQPHARYLPCEAKAPANPAKKAAAQPQTQHKIKGSSTAATALPVVVRCTAWIPITMSTIW